ncbi:hypothetical protein [Yinghuangia seranimata]|uniref:hypothetical protein n=1 Tax=Yinghuangia seranimata TaxID=408067 RepID=UPI00248AEDE4|nr:hypothetical protein [Yinghuangia seranimata]MDI2129102.1 hypothetical protein [Yinghuangia seranimata]
MGLTPHGSEPHCVHTGTDGQIYHARFDGTQWSQPRSLNSSWRTGVAPGLFGDWDEMWMSSVGMDGYAHLARSTSPDSWLFNHTMPKADSPLDVLAALSLAILDDRMCAMYYA